MADLVVVESPTKAKTIERYLGSGFKVLASYGHVRDLPKSDFAVQVQDGGGCELTYEVPGRSAKHVAALRKAAKAADRVWLAPDLDREGEAIAWHVAELLGLDPQEQNRVTFDEITQSAIQAAFEQPRQLNLALIDAQQARRAVDRIVGYRLSPVLWRTVSAGISAGRVQSVALRLIVDREDAIRAFVPREYWSLHGDFEPEGGRASIGASLHTVGDRRVATPRDLDKKEADDEALAKLLVIGDEDTARDLERRSESLTYDVREVRRSEAKRNPSPPFTTSTLQQDAARKLGFSAARTMRVAQQLYEGVALGAEGQTGLITYMRTDSLNLSDTALGEINTLVAQKYGERYTVSKWRRFKTKQQRAQEAHEAIRPTSAHREPEAVRANLSDDQYRLYDLIWKRTMATQMAPAIFDRVSADVVGTEPDGTVFLWRVTGQVLKFDGFIRVYEEGRDEDAVAEESSDRLPEIEEGQVLELAEVAAEQHFTTPPPRFTEASLVKELEAEGIGRPSTYASIIQTLRDREYVTMDGRRFTPTPLGEVVVSFLKVHFGEVVDINFTARMEETLDEIAAGDEAWCHTVTRFLEEVDTWVDERKPERPRFPLPEHIECPVCGTTMDKVFSGKSKQWFASCSRWPDCDGTRPIDEHGEVGEPEPEPEPDERVRCLECGKPMLLKSGRYGRFYGCVDYPKCKGIRNLSHRAVYLDGDEWKPFISPTDGTSFMELRTSRYGKPFLGSAGYPDDQFAIWSVPIADPCPSCGAPMRQPPKNRKVPLAICANPTIEHRYELADWDPPSVHTIEVVPGVEEFDPAVGGEPIAGWPEPYESIAMSFDSEGEPPKKRPSKKKAAKKKKATKKKATKKKAAKKKATEKES